MNPETTAAVVIASVFSGSLGFLLCGLLTARRLADRSRYNYWEGYEACNRAHHHANKSVPKSKS